MRCVSLWGFFFFLGQTVKLLINTLDFRLSEVFVVIGKIKKRATTTFLRYRVVFIVTHVTLYEPFYLNHRMIRILLV